MNSERKGEPNVPEMGMSVQKTTVPNDNSESSMALAGKNGEANEVQEGFEGSEMPCKIIERRGSGRGRGRGRPPGRRSSVRSSGRVSPRSPRSPRSPGRSPARAASISNDHEFVDHSGMAGELTMDVTEKSENESEALEKAESPSRSPRSRYKTRKISKTVAAELANNTAIEHEEETVVPAKRPRRRSTPVGIDEPMNMTGTQESHVPIHHNLIDTEDASETAIFDMLHDDEDEDENEDEELDDVDQHMDTAACNVAEDTVVKCKFCPFTVQAGDEKAQLNLRKHEQHHFRKSKYSCKHCAYSSGRLLVIKKHLEVLHSDASGLVIQRPQSSVKFTGKKIKMSFSFIKKNAFFKPLGLASRKALALEKVEKDTGPDSKAHNHHTRAGGKRVSPRAKATCPCCVPDGKGDGRRNHNCLQAGGSDEDKIDVGEETNENADLDSTLSPATKRIRMEDSKQETLVVYGELGKKVGLKCHHCPFQLPWNHGVTSRMHAHEACHFRTSQFECTLCGWNGGNIIAGRKHMTVHPDAKSSDLLKRWGKQFKSTSGTTDGSIAARRKASHLSGCRNVAATNMEIMKSLTQKARIIKANTLKCPGKYGNNTVGALLQRKRDETIGFKPVGKTIKEILNLKGETTKQNSLPVQQMVSILSPTKDVVGSAKTVRALLDQTRNVQTVGSPNKPHVTLVSLPKYDGANDTYLQCPYCPYKVRRSANTAHKLFWVKFG